MCVDGTPAFNFLSFSDKQEHINPIETEFLSREKMVQRPTK